MRLHTWDKYFPSHDPSGYFCTFSVVTVLTVLFSSDENGLYLVLGAVHEDGPAYECGLRSGDVIVTVSDWLITVMDKPEVRDTDKLL